MQRADTDNLINKFPASIVFIVGGSYLFGIFNFTYFIMFGDFLRWNEKFFGWIYLIPIIFLSPGWLVSLYKCRDIKSLLYWMFIAIIASVFINFMAHYGLGAGDLGPGPV